MELSNFPKFQQFFGKKLLGVDYGGQVIGTATFTPGRDPFVTPYQRIIVQTERKTFDQLTTIISDEEVDIIIFGLPLYKDGTLSPTARTVKEFAKKLQKHPLYPKELKHYFQDETLTSFEAQDRMKNSSRYNFRVDPKEIDNLSAAIIVEDFIKSE